MEGVGTFPPNRPPRVLWMGVGSGHPRLFQLRQRLDDALLASGLQLDVRTFHPHVTLARLRDVTPRAVAYWLAMHGAARRLDFEATRFVLLSSRASTGGGPYVLEESYPLGAHEEDDDHAEAHW